MTYCTLSLDALPSRARPLRQRVWRVALCIVPGALLLLGPGILHAQHRRVLERIPPIYPTIAMQMQIQGIVRVVATVDTFGKVVSAESSSLERLLVPAALDAVRKWRFEPGPGTQVVTIDVQFRL